MCVYVCGKGEYDIRRTKRMTTRFFDIAKAQKRLNVHKQRGREREREREREK